MVVPKRVKQRLANAMKQYLPIVEQQRSRDVSEADTVTLVKDLLSDVFGFDKYTDLTGEYAIRGTYCDLAVRVDDKLSLLIEVKAIGITLDDRHLKQAVNYAANEGIEWVILTNGIIWRLYAVTFGKPIGKVLVAEADLTQPDIMGIAGEEQLYMFTKEGIKRGVHEASLRRQEATNRYLIAALLLGNRRVVNTIRRELRQIIDIKVGTKDITKVLREEVIKRETLQDPEAEKAKATVRKAGGQLSQGASNAGNQASTRKRSKVTVIQLIERGLINAPAQLFRVYKGQRVEATLHIDGTIEYATHRHANPSRTAALARASVIGEKKATNGWTFWQCIDAKGRESALADLREIVDGKLSA